MRFQEMISFDDVLLEPKYSEIRSRSEVDLSVDLGKGFKFKIPFIPANMQSVVSEELIGKFFECGGLSILHRFDTIENQIGIIDRLKGKFGDAVLNFVGVSVGVMEQDYDNLKTFNDIGVKIYCVDIAHLNSIHGLEMVKYIATNYPEALLIAGNVATDDGATNAWRAGADVVKIGIGGGSICSTRIQAAAGVPQLSAIIRISEYKPAYEKALGRKLFSISDGSARTAGDCVKALCFSDMVMLGSYFAGADEAAGEEIEINGQKLKSYHGSSTHKSSRIEGVKSVVHKRGPVVDLIRNLSEGVQSGCSYQGVNNLQSLKEDPSFIRITNAGLIESRIHDVTVL